MRNSYKILILAFIFIGANVIFASAKEPWWVTKRHHQNFTNSYIKVITNSSDLSEEDAAGIEYENELVRQGLDRAKAKERASRFLGTDPNFNVLDSYSIGRTRYWLVQFPKYNMLGMGDEAREYLVPVRFTPWAFLPSAAQFYKGQWQKGVGILAGEVAFLGGIIGTASMAPVYESRAASAGSVELARWYANKGTTMRNLEYVCIGGFVAVYVWSVIDGCVSKGHKFKVDKSRSGYNYRAHFELAPSMVDPGNLALSLKF